MNLEREKRADGGKALGPPAHGWLWYSLDLRMPFFSLLSRQKDRPPPLFFLRRRHKMPLPVPSRVLPIRQAMPIMPLSYSVVISYIPAHAKMEALIFNFIARIKGFIQQSVGLVCWALGFELTTRFPPSREV